MKSSPDMQITHFRGRQKKKNQNLALMMWAGRESHLPQGNAKKPFSSAVSTGENLPEAALGTERILDELAPRRELGLGRWVFSSLPPPSCLSGREGLLGYFHCLSPGGAVEVSETPVELSSGYEYPSPQKPL